MLKDFFIDDGLVMGHINPDADSLCSGISMTKMLIEHGKKAKLYINSNIQRQYSWILEENKEIILEDINDSFINKAKNFYIMDCEPSFDRTGFKFPYTGNIINIDHHWHRVKNSSIKGDCSKKNHFYGECYCDDKLVLLYLEDVVSTSSIMVKRFNRKDDVLAVGIYFDSAELTVKTADAIHTISSLNIDEERLDYMIRSCKNYANKDDWMALVGLKTWWTESGEICVCYDTSKYSDWQNILKTLERYFGVIVFVHKNKNISIRSGMNKDVSSIAIKYGGGGHKGAAGFRIDKNFSFVELINKIKNENFSEISTIKDSGICDFEKDIHKFLKG